MASDLPIPIPPKKADTDTIGTSLIISSAFINAILVLSLYIDYRGKFGLCHYKVFIFQNIMVNFTSESIELESFEQ